MQIKRLIVFIFLVSFLFGILNTNVKSEQIERNSKIAADLNKNIGDEKVRVIIKFKDDSRKLNIQSDESKIKNKFENSAVAFLNESEIEEYSKRNDVESISLDHIRTIDMQDAKNIVNASISWPLKVGGLNLTGIGQTVCILDTGINASHPDLNSSYIGGYDYCADDVTCTSEDTTPNDKHGHGTHVSGIVAANGGIIGIAPESKVVVIKVCNSSGSCADSDIRSGIDWCINNASAKNISVISMSIGGGSYNTYCDNDESDNSDITGAINNAVTRNISVIVASGNDGIQGSISFPACIRNTTAVGSTTKADAISSFSNRYSLMNLFAPGSSINSTYLSGYAISSGTSMSTPTVAASFALIKEFLNLTNQLKTPKEIETVLNNTGKRITDTNGVNYSRINVYGAIISLDSLSPNVTLISPANNSVNGSSSVTFRCNASDLSLRNVTFYLWNSTNSVINNTFRSISGATNNFEANITNLSNSNYKWNCLYTDENNNTSFAQSNFSLIISGINTTLSTPVNNLITNRNQSFVCNATSLDNNGLSNVTFYLWNSSTLENTIFRNVSGLSNGSIFNYNFTHQDSDYKWNCLFVNNVSTSSFAISNFSLNYDLQAPNFSITSPINTSYYNSGNFNITLSENGTCIYSLNNGILNYSMSTANNVEFNHTNTTLIHNQSYNVNYYCNDSAGNINNSVQISFNIDSTTPNVTLVTPYPTDETIDSVQKTFYYNAIDELNITSCSLLLNGVAVATNSTINQSLNQSFSREVSVSEYNWRVNCTDLAGNTGNSSFQSFTITQPSSSSSGGGGGGGGGGSGIVSKTYSPSNAQLNEGYTNNLAISDKIDFQSNQINHSLKVLNINADSALIEIRSDPMQISLRTGQSIRLNLSSSEYYDLFLKLESVNSTFAKINIKTIKEPINVDNVRQIQDNAIIEKNYNSPSELVNSETGIKSNLFGLSITLIVVFLAILSIFKIRKAIRKHKSYTLG